MKIKLRDYQDNAVSKTYNAFRKNKKVIMSLPTGGGKTVIFAAITKRAVDKGNSVTILVHRIELVKQTFNMLLNFGITANLIVAGQKTQPGRVNIAMVETFNKRYRHCINDLGIDLLIVDEAHIGNFRKLIKPFDKYVLGVSASPIAASRTDPLNSYFGDIVVPIQIGELIGMGYLSRGITYSIDYDFGQLKKRAGEFTEASLLKEFRKPVLYEGAIEFYEKYCSGQKAMCFCVNVEHSELTAQDFWNAGHRSAHVDGKTPQDERNHRITGYTHGTTDVLCNCGITTTGFDHVHTRCIIQNYATTQLAKKVQTEGRGGRIFQDLKNIFTQKKDTFIIIDLGRNYARHGLYGQPIDWEGIFHQPSRATNPKEDKKLIECDKCAAIIKITNPKCPYCGDERSPQRVERQLKMLAPPPDLKKIRQVKKLSLPQHLRNLRFSEMTESELHDYCNHMGYKKSWVYIQLRNRKKR